MWGLWTAHCLPACLPACLPTVRAEIRLMDHSVFLVNVRLLRHNLRSQETL